MQKLTMAIPQYLKSLPTKLPLTKGCPLSTKPFFDLGIGLCGFYSFTHRGISKVDLRLTPSIEQNELFKDLCAF